MGERSGGVLTEADERDEKTDAGTYGQNERVGHDAGEPLPKAKQREDEENPARRRCS